MMMVFILIFFNFEIGCIYNWVCCVDVDINILMFNVINCFGFMCSVFECIVFEENKVIIVERM